MIFHINSDFFERLIFYPKNFCRKEDRFSIVEDGIRYHLSPQDSIIYKNQEIALQPFYETIKKCENFLWENYPDWMKRSSEPFRLSFIERNGQATAYYSMNQEKKDPKEIVMCMSYFLNLHDFKFVLGHELGHFHEYLSDNRLKPKTSDEINMVIGCLFVFALTFVTATFLMPFKGRLPDAMILFDILFAFFSFFYYFAYSSSHFNNVLNSHYAEFEADRFSINLFPECSTAYFKKKWLYSDTHPANYLRILALNKNIRIYIPVILPWYLSYSDSYKEFKAACKESLKEVPKTPIYFIEILKNLILDGLRTIKTKQLSKNSNINKKKID